MAQPSPISTTPAFSSPALTRIFAPVVGNFFSSFLEFLYEQCSLHITEKIPSSVKFGSRPRIFLTRSNSSGVRPCCLTSSGVTTGSACGVLLVISVLCYRIRDAHSNRQNRKYFELRQYQGLKIKRTRSVRSTCESRTLRVN